MTKGAGFEKTDLQALARGQYPIAFQEFQAAANPGAAVAQYYLAHMDEFGLGVGQSEMTALRWYLLTAEQGHVEAQVCLGRMYETANGIENGNRNFKGPFWLDRKVPKNPLRGQSADSEE